MAIQPTIELSQAIRAYKSGDRKAFSAIYRLSRPYLAKCAANVVNRVAPNAPGDLMEDVLQDTFMTIAEKLDTLQNEDAYFQWAGQIVTNHTLRACKKDSVWWNMEQPEDDLVYEEADERFIPEDILENQEKQQLIRGMLQQLPSGQYMCLVEYFYNDLKEREIADKLEMPLGTVKTNLSRAKKKLKDIVQTHEKKNGVKLYSMSWLLLVLFWDDIKAMFPAAVKAGTLVVEEVPVLYAAGTGAAGGASGATGGFAAMGIGTKIVAGVVAAALALGLGTAAALVLPEKETPRIRDGIYLQDADWDHLPELTPMNVAVIENALGGLEPGKAAKGETIRVDTLPEDHAQTPDGVLCNVEFIDTTEMVLTGENADGKRMEVTVNCDGNHWTVQSAQETEYANRLYPINEAMRQKGFPAVLYGMELTDAHGLACDGAFCMGMMYWKDILGHTNFSVTSVGQRDVWQIPHLGEPDYYDPEVYDNVDYEMWDAVWIHRETLEFWHGSELVGPDAPQEIREKLIAEATDPELPGTETAAPENTKPAATEPVATEPAVAETTAPVEVSLQKGEVLLDKAELEYFNSIAGSIVLLPPPTGPAVPYRQGDRNGQVNDVVFACSGPGEMIDGTVTPEGLVVKKADVTKFMLDVFGWEPRLEVNEYSGILEYGDDAYLLPNRVTENSMPMKIHNIRAESYDRVCVTVPRGYTSYLCTFARSSESPYGWILVEAVDTQQQIDERDVIKYALLTHAVVLPADGSEAYAPINFEQELSMESAKAYISHYLWKTTGERPAEVTGEEWGLVANNYYTYKITANWDNGDQKVYLIGTSDSAIAEYLGADVPRHWFQWNFEK